MNIVKPASFEVLRACEVFVKNMSQTVKIANSCDSSTSCQVVKSSQK